MNKPTGLPPSAPPRAPRTGQTGGARENPRAQKADKTEKVSAAQAAHAVDELDETSAADQKLLSEPTRQGLAKAVDEGIFKLGEKWYGKGADASSFLRALGEISGHDNASMEAATKIVPKETIDLYATRLSRQLQMPKDQATELMVALATVLAPE